MRIALPNSKMMNSYKAVIKAKASIAQLRRTQSNTHLVEREMYLLQRRRRLMRVKRLSSATTCSISRQFKRDHCNLQIHQSTRLPSLLSLLTKWIKNTRRRRPTSFWTRRKIGL